jgi:5-methyltetrahydropteroyltriglutamate--homocysteine methyltransferase
MLVATRDMPLATTVTGSLPRPGWCDCRLDGQPLGVRLADRGFREQYTDLLAAYVSDQTRAGLDILVDGDARLDDGVGGRHWFAYVEERLTGLGPPELRSYAVHRGKAPGTIMHEVLETRLPATVIDKVGRGSLDYPVAWKAAQAMTDRPMKLGGISAQILEASLNNDYYTDRRALVNDMADITNAEFHALADAGCPVIQVEEPCVHGIAGLPSGALLSAEDYVAAFNREVQGLRDKTEVWCHTCWGNPLAQRTRDRAHGYAAALPYLNQLDVDVLTFETCENNGAELQLIGRQVSSEKKIAIGVVSHRTLQVEPAEDVADMIRRALEHIPPERLILSSDCGFGRHGMSRAHALYKMAAVTQGTNIVRRELGLAEVAVPLADRRFELLAADD